MKVRYMSDLHLEFGVPVGNLQGSKDEVLVLAGDIFALNGGHGNKYLSEFTTFMQNASNQFKAVIMILGNHDHWGTVVDLGVPEYWKAPYEFRSPTIYATLCEKMENVHVLYSGMSVVIDDVAFVGATLWTDLNNDNPITKLQAQQGMMDFRFIKVYDPGNQYTYGLTREMYADEWVKMNVIDTKNVLDELDRVHNDTTVRETVLVIHMAPFSESVNAKYKGDPMNYAFYNTVFDREIYTGLKGVNTIIHGHMHMPVDYKIEHIHVVSNPRGYVSPKWQENPVGQFDLMKTMEI